MAEITTAISEQSQNLYADNYKPLPGQLNINKVGAGAISDPTLGAGIVPIFSGNYLTNKLVVTTSSMPTSVASTFSVIPTRAMGNDFNREFWF